MVLAARDTVVSLLCWSWQRGPWHLLHPGSLVRWGHTAREKQDSIPISILSFGPSCQYEEKRQSEVHLPSFQRTTVRKGGLSCQVGEGSWQGEAGGQTWG